MNTNGSDRQLGLITGATSTLGATLAARLAHRFDLMLLGRSEDRLERCAERCRQAGAVATTLAGDLTNGAFVSKIVRTIGDGPLALCLLNAGEYSNGRLADTPIDEVERLLALNVVANLALLRAVLPAIRRVPGDIIVMNSTQSLVVRPGAGAFAASQHALRAITTVIRDEEFEARVRVLGVHLGRTATERQERIFDAEGRPWTPDALVQPDDVADVIEAALRLPRRAELSEVTLLPMWRG